MKKNISVALLTLACFSALSAAAFADGPIGRTINGIGRAGEDIADGVGDAIDGAGDAVSDVVDGVTGDNNNTDDSVVDPGATDDPVGADSSDVSVDTSSDITSDEVSSEESASGTVGGINAANPPMGVSYGLTAGAAVLAALGVVVSAARKDK